MERKNIIVTGASSGIGLELMKLLLKEDHKIGLILRDEMAADKVKEIVGKADSDKIDFFFADLSVQIDIISVTKLILSKWDTIDILFNNAGVLLGEKIFSFQKNEMHFEVNTIAPYLLTINLYPALAKANEALVVNTATDLLHKIKKLKTNELINVVKFKKLLGSYLQSKLAATLLMNAITNEWQTIRVLNVSPGGNKTKLSLGTGMPNLLKPFVHLLYKKPEVGARRLYEAALGERFKDRTRVFIQNNKIEPLSAALNDEQRLELLQAIKPEN